MLPGMLTLLLILTLTLTLGLGWELGIPRTFVGESTCYRIVSFSAVEVSNLLTAVHQARRQFGFVWLCFRNKFFLKFF